MKKKVFIIILIVLTTLLAVGSVLISVYLSSQQNITPEKVDALSFTNYRCSGSCTSGRECNQYGNPPAGKMWSCWYNNSAGGYRCAYSGINEGGNSCWGCPGNTHACGCDTSACNTACLKKIPSSGGSATYSMNCSSCQQLFTCSCSKGAPPGDKLSCGDSGCNAYNNCESGNICNANVCQKLCPSGTTRIGDCTCSTPPTTPPITTPPTTPPTQIACGDSGCNALNNCVSGNICNANVCQSICPAGTVRVGDCTCSTPSTTPSETPTNTPTETPTNTPTITITGTITITETPTNTPTLTLTGTITPTDNVTPTTSNIPKTAIISDDTDRMIAGIIFVIAGLYFYFSGNYLVLGNIVWDNGGKRFWNGTRQGFDPLLNGINKMFTHIDLAFNNIKLSFIKFKDSLTLGSLEFYKKLINNIKNINKNIKRSISNIGLSKKDKFEKDLLNNKKHE